MNVESSELFCAGGQSILTNLINSNRSLMASTPKLIKAEVLSLTTYATNLVSLSYSKKWLK